MPEYLPLSTASEDLLPGPCRSCAWWQTAGIARVSPATAANVRRRWTSAVECTWGHPGLIRLPDGRLPASSPPSPSHPDGNHESRPPARADSGSPASGNPGPPPVEAAPVGTSTPEPPVRWVVHYAPAATLPRLRDLMFVNPAPGAVVLFCLRSDGPADSRAAGRLLHAALKQLRQERLREVYALACHDGGAPYEDHCEFFSLTFLEANGFERLRTCGDLVLMRADLRMLLSVLAPLENALRRLFHQEEPSPSPTAWTLQGRS